MNVRPVLPAIAVVAALCIAAYGGYWYANRQSLPASPPAAGDARETPGNSGFPATQTRKILYWHDPMKPDVKFDKPGKSPFMDMDLQPVYADDAPGGGVRISPAVTQSLGVRSVEATLGAFERRVDAVGTVEADERRISVLQSRAAGWLEKLHVRAIGEPVRRGAPVAEIYAPELLAAQEEYLLLLAGASGAELNAAARERLLLLGLTEGQIQTLEKLREPTRRVVLHAPSSGIVTELGAREGAAVSPGTPIASIVDLSRVWIVAQVPETQLALIATGRPVEARLAAMIGELYEGKVEYIYPDIDPATRTVKVRFSVDNGKLKLRPGMVASVTAFGGMRNKALMVPSEAVIRTGTRSVVIVDEGEGRFRAQEVAVGAESDDQTEVTQGLQPGEKVLVSGQFLIDSEASLKGAIARLDTADVEEPTTPATAQPDSEHVALGTVKSVDTATGRVMIAHGPVASLDWPAMTMGFAVKDKALLERLKPGQQIDFRFVEGDPDYQLTAAAPRNSGGAK